MADERITVRLPDGMREHIRERRGETAEGEWVVSVIRSVLAGELAPVQPPAIVPGARSVGPGIPAPGVLCMWAACMSKDSDRYGVADPGELQRTDYREHRRDEDKSGIALCKAHAAILEGRRYSAPRRELPANWQKAPQPA